jgi:peptidoglycan/LPS O-acetylase OafA/YrhL
MAMLGKYTFSMYLVHIPVLLTVGASVFLLVYPAAGFHWAALAAVSASLPVVALVSYWFEKYVDAPAIRASGMFANWILELPQKPGTEFELPKESNWLRLKRFVAGKFNKIVR